MRERVMYDYIRGDGRLFKINYDGVHADINSAALGVDAGVIGMVR